MNQLQDFVKLLSQFDVDNIGNGSDAYYVNLFRYKDKKGMWTRGGYDTFGDASEQQDWYNEYLRYPENKKEEMMAATVDEILNCWDTIESNNEIESYNGP